MSNLGEGKGFNKHDNPNFANNNIVAVVQVGLNGLPLSNGGDTSGITLDRNATTSGTIGTSATQILPSNVTRTYGEITNNTGVPLMVYRGNPGSEILVDVIADGAKYKIDGNNPFLTQRFSVATRTGSVTLTAGVNVIGFEISDNASLDPHVTTVSNRIKANANGYTLNTQQLMYLDTLIKNTKIATGGTYDSTTKLVTGGSLPYVLFDANVSVNLNNSVATKVFNLGSAGATADGTLINGNVGSMVGGLGTQRYFTFAAASSQSIDTTQPTKVEGTWLANVRPAGTGERCVVGANNNSAVGLVLTSGNAVLFERLFQTSIDSSTNLAANSIWSSLSLSFSDTSNAYNMNVNYIQDKTGTTDLTWQVRNLCIGRKITTSYFDGRIANVAIFDDILSSAVANRVNSVLVGSLK